MKWEHPPIIKVYEALGAVADGRVEASGNTAKVYSSSGNKFYDVTFDPMTKAIMANDNASYWKGYCGYPIIAYFLKVGILKYNSELGNLLKGIPWKDINQEFKNDFNKTLRYIQEPLTHIQARKLSAYTQDISEGLKKLDLDLLGKRISPPEGY